MTNTNSTPRLFERFQKVNRTFPETDQIRELKANGGKVFGWLCTYVPEELIYAAGALPVRVTGYQNESELPDGTAYLSTVSCSFSRSCLQMVLRGDYQFLDGIIAGSTCDGARRLFDHWRQYVKPHFSHILSVPRKSNASTLAFYYHEVLSLKNNLENYLGVNIKDTALEEAITVYDQSREIMTQLSELRKQDTPPITGAQILEVFNAAPRLPRKIFNSWASELLSSLKTSPVKHTSKARILIVGSVLNNISFIESIESQGALVVADGLCSGIRYYSDPVKFDGTGSPLQAIARRYLTGFPCARMFPSQERFDRITQLLKDYRVDGIINETIRYCVQNAHDTPLLNEMAGTLHIPILNLDIEYGTSGSGQVQTRVQAFLEMLEAKHSHPDYGGGNVK